MTEIASGVAEPYSVATNTEYNLMSHDRQLSGAHAALLSAMETAFAEDGSFSWVLSRQAFPDGSELGLSEPNDLVTVTTGYRTTAHETAAAELAGQRRVLQLATTHGERRGILKRTGYDHIVGMPATAGYEIRMQVTKAVAMQAKSVKGEALLASAQAAGIVLFGEGIVGLEGFRLSQKMHGVNRVAQGRTTLHGNKSMHHATTRDILIGQTGHIDILSGDSSLSPRQIELQIAAAKLVVRLIANGAPDRLQLPTFTDPLSTAKRISADMTLRQAYATTSGLTMTAIDYCSELGWAAESLAKEIALPADEQAVAKYLQMVPGVFHNVAPLEGELGTLPSQLPWAWKYRKLLADCNDPLAIRSHNTAAVAIDLRANALGKASISPWV